ncbi:MAG: HAD family phosphatase [Thermodesulfobacteriota bacterium]
MTDKIHAILIDYGGVLAEEGFREGLMAIARANGLDEREFFRQAAGLAYQSGYVIGKTNEAEFWDLIRRKTGVRGSDQELRQELFSRFVLRPWMVELVRRVRRQVDELALLSDQTNWLDELDARDGFFHEFDRILNSYHMGKGKTDPTIFLDVVRKLGKDPQNVLFIDDNEGHVGRARSQGLKVHLFVDRKRLWEELKRLGLDPGELDADPRS